MNARAVSLDLALCLVLAACGSDDGEACPEVTDESPAAHLVCPGLQTCAECPTLGTGGGSIVDGTYSLVESVVWASACGVFTDDVVHASLIVHGATMEVVYTGPSSLANDIATTRATYGFTTGSGKIMLMPTCPATSDAMAVAYEARDSWLTLTLPGIPGTASFRRR